MKINTIIQGFLVFLVLSSTVIAQGSGGGLAVRVGDDCNCIWDLEIFGFGLKDLLNLGFLGGIVFFLSWILQSIQSRRAGRSVVSIQFWIMRFTGMCLLLIYSINRRDLVYIMANSVGIMLTIYNMYLTWRRRDGEV